MAIKGVRYLSFPPGTGYGESAQDYISALRSADVPVSWTPIGWGRDTEGGAHSLALFAGERFGAGRHDDVCNLAIDADTLLVHCEPVWNPEWNDDRPAQRLIAYTTYETDGLPAERVSILNHYDMVLVPSTHNFVSFSRAGVRVPIRVVPHIVRAPRRVKGSGVADLADDVFVFYVISTWVGRKALPETITAFLDAFTGDESVALVVKTTAEDRVALGQIKRGRPADTSPHYGTSWWSLAKLLRGRRNPPRIHLITSELSRRGIEKLHTRGDCFVSLSRGEGWSLGPFEAAAYGNPVVLTGYGGHLDYLPPGYPYLVDYELVEPAKSELDDWFKPGPGERWARPDVGQASALLRSVYERQDRARAWGRHTQRRVTEEFSRQRVGEQLLSAIKECRPTGPTERPAARVA